VTESPDDLTLVQVAWWEVDPSVLEEPGGPLAPLTAHLDVTLVSEHAEQTWSRVLATPGWRLLADDSEKPTQRMAFAAPDTSAPGTWLVVLINKRNGEWQLAQLFESEAVRPGRAARRQHLSLGWPKSEFVCPAGQVPELTATLVNRGPDDWIVGEDHLHVVAWLLDPITREALPSDKWVAHGWVDGSQVLRPGEEVDLPVRLLTLRVEELPLGEYGILAMVSSLNLRSEPGRLLIR